MKSPSFLTGFSKLLIYLWIILHIPFYYGMRPRFFSSPAAYVRFLWRAFHLLLVFRHNKIVRVFNGYKLHLYLPAYPSEAFFYAIESKLLKSPPGPTTVVFSMTKACSYHCEHCYQKKDSSTDLDEALMIRTALAVRDTGVAMFDIEGGEPFIRFPRLLALVKSLDARSEIWINTTGAHVKPGMLDELKRAGLFGVMVSIHAPDRKKHDTFTGVTGSFDTACHFIKTCRDHDLVVACNAVLSEDDIRNGELDRLMDLTRALKCDFVQLIHPKPSGLWLGKKEGMQTDQKIIQAIQQEHVRYNSRSKQSYPALAAQVFEEQRTVLGCTAGAADRYYVGAGGEVQPCEFLNISFGNVNEESFTVIFERMRSFFKTPCSDWLCCTQAEAIQQLFVKHHITQTPIPWKITRELVESWERGSPTPIYEKLGIYP
ncbi:MAG: radical SAM protein [Kiritimatiellaceae bacterium]|nr:radical SAM protein [Kiritimatiellaceae bacterium]